MTIYKKIDDFFNKEYKIIQGLWTDINGQMTDEGIVEVDKLNWSKVEAYKSALSKYKEMYADMAILQVGFIAYGTLGALICFSLCHSPINLAEQLIYLGGGTIVAAETSKSLARYFECKHDLELTYSLKQ